MLQHLSIRNFALIDTLDLTLAPGLNVLTGETGAGKSILLDAVDLVLGGKASAMMVRQGCDRTLVEATFLPGEGLGAWLADQGIDPLEEGVVICSRELMLSKGGLRSRSRVNGVLINRPTLQRLREQLIEITAQGQMNQLLQSDRQRALLDLYGGEGLGIAVERVARNHRHYQHLYGQWQQRQRRLQEDQQRLDGLRYQWEELQQGGLGDPEELAQRQQECDRLLHAVELRRLAYGADQSLYQNDHDRPTAADLLGQALGMVQQMGRYDSAAGAIGELLDNALTLIAEASHALHHYGDRIEADPDRLAEGENRVQQLKQLIRKYAPGGDLRQVIAYQTRVQEELEQLQDRQPQLAQLEEQWQIAQREFLAACTLLSQARQQAADRLSQDLVQHLKPLAMGKVRFACQLEPKPPGPQGAEQVVFAFSPNPGEPLQPLGAIASGGEMNRFLLALKTCFARTPLGAATLIFDEIDAGVSGKVAQAIAHQLHDLSLHHQILCVTHQPLIAALADAHYRVEKTSQGERTTIAVEHLPNHQSRQVELAQLTGGHAATEALPFAHSLLVQAAAHKQTHQPR